MNRKRIICRVVPLILVYLTWCLVCQADSVVVFNEIMYHPAVDEERQEWVELHNQMAYDMDLSRWSIRGGVRFEFPEGSKIHGGGYLVVAISPDELLGSPGYAMQRTEVPVLGPFEGRLANSGEELRLHNNSGRIMDVVEYSDAGDWPVAPDGSGVSLAKFDPDTASAPPENWTWSNRIGGTPGTRNFPAMPLGPGLVSLVDKRAEAWVLVPSDDSLGLAWTETVYDTTGWLSGRTGVGYETRLEQPVSYEYLVGLDVEDAMRGRNSGCYVRIPFVVEEPSAFTSLTLLMRYDAGFVAYLNGAELQRANAPTSVTWDSESDGLHSGSTAVIPEVFDVSVGLSFLNPGTNTLAIHALSNGRSPRSFLMLPELIADESAQAENSGRLAFNEVTAASGDTFWVEILNQSNESIDLAGYALKSAGTVSGDTVLAAQSVAPGGYLVLAESVLGFHPADEDKLFLYNPGGTRVLDAIAVKNRPRGRYPEGIGSWLYPSAPTLGALNRFTFHDEIVINEIMYHQRPQADEPEIPPVYETAHLLPVDAEWRYEQSGSDLGQAWREPGYDDGAWLRGPGALGKAFGDLPIRTDLNVSGQTTFYFRSEFSHSGDLGDGALMLDAIIDDGAIFYLNGVEVYRENMPDGQVDYFTTAKESVRIPTFSGPIPISAKSLVAGTNVLAVEVYQVEASSTDILMGVALLQRKVETPGIPAKPYVENTEEWIELYNRSDHAVDLGGWRLADGIDFLFGQGTVLEPDAYMVVANDANALRKNCPGIRNVGDFQRALSNGGERIVLLDADGNPADEVRYYDYAPWPYTADGYSASLELRDPRADNSKPEAWAASDQSAESEWQTIVYREVADQTYGLSQWNEFVVGMLDAGEVLLDDISVIEDPDGEAVQLIQNGTFETEYRSWRINGNHRHSRITVDPDDPTNPVLQLIATGPTRHEYNHAETTFKGNRRVDYRKTYEISLRSRWLEGSNQLNVRIYSTRLARTILLDVPEHSGTPGARNSRFEENIGPTLSDLAHTPVLPLPKEPVTISVSAQDPDGVSSCTLWWATSGSWDSARILPMTPDEGGLYAATIPGHAEAQVVQFYIEAKDNLGTTSTYPAAGRRSGAFYVVAAGQDCSTGLSNFRLIMPPSSLDYWFAADNVNIMSNDRLPATVIGDRDKVHYNVGVRLRGSMVGRTNSHELAGSVSNPHVGYNIRFPTDNLFRGVHTSVSIDRSGWTPVYRGQEDIYIKNTFNRAGIPCMYDDLIYFIAPRRDHTQSAILQMARYGNVFLDSQWAKGDEGTVFNFDLIYYFTETVGGPENPKAATVYATTIRVTGTDLKDLGDSKESYRWFLQIKNNRRRDEYSGIMAFCKAMNLPTEQLRVKSKEVMDVDEWMRCYAMLALWGVTDIYSLPHWDLSRADWSSSHHNLRLYVPADNPRVLALPWDMDLSYRWPPTNPIWGPEETNLQRLALIPENRRLFYGHLRDLVQTTFNASYMEPWIENHKSLLPKQNFADNLYTIGGQNTRGLVSPMEGTLKWRTKRPI